MPKKCPKCGGTTFLVDAHVVQGWKVDSEGSFLDETEKCIEVTHYPDDDDIWECAKCGYGTEGSAFNVK